MSGAMKHLWHARLRPGLAWRWLPSAAPYAECSACDYRWKGGYQTAVDAWNLRAWRDMVARQPEASE